MFIFIHVYALPHEIYIFVVIAVVYAIIYVCIQFLVLLERTAMMEGF